MPKQIKIGFDKTLSPKVATFEPLYDISGVQLQNQNQEPLFTEEKGVLKEFYSSKKALSSHFNNDPKTPVKVIEQFPETSQVSSSLLGVPRDEKQLGLFADVSTYGFNDTIWEFFTSGGPGGFAQWNNRKNKDYGNRYGIRVEEIVEEQAIALKAFPISYSFPYSPRFGSTGGYSSALYSQYVNFFELGRILYDAYINDEDERFELFAIENFLSPEVGYIQNQEVIYNPNLPLETVFEEIEKWTMAWIKLRNGTLFFPNSIKVEFPEGYDVNNTRPGYSSTSGYYGQIQSRKVFRYQPGRISGFTFGLRSSSDQASLNNIIEWGCANDTDEYMFQIRGPNFNIVRRSTVPLPAQNLIDMGLNPQSQVLVNPSNPFTSGTFNPDTGGVIPLKQLYEIVIPRDKFNNDSLDGNGPSGYILTPEQVTMYKIEFSWYGAIGAKFYAYVPIGNGDARWVLIHTLIIENKIGEPCLNDPYFRFKYVMKINETSNLVEPQFVYKYGASYYIDGGDEGASVTYSTSSEKIQASPLFTRSALGISAKTLIKNKNGQNIKNKKNIIPDNISVITDNPIRIDIIDCEGCPGFGHHYAPSLVNGTRATPANVTFNSAGTSIFYSDDASFTINDIDKKIIGSGIYSTYVANISEDFKTATIKRKISTAEPDINSNYSNTNFVVLSNGALKAIKNQEYNVRLTGYDDVAVSTLQLTKPNIDINFLNPSRNDGGSFADFYIGVTNKEPSLDPLTDELLLDSLPYDSNNVLYAEWTNSGVNLSIDAYETSESDQSYGTIFEIDPQIKTPAGVNSGVCSKMSVRVTEFVVNSTFTTTHPITGAPGNFLIFDSSNSILSSLEGLEGGQIGIESGGNYIASSTTFVDDKATFYVTESGSKYYVTVSDNGLASESKIIFRVIRIYGRYINKTKVFSFDLYPLYIVIGMRDKAAIHNITIEEYDSVNKFSYSPQWLISPLSFITVINSGTLTESLNANNGAFNSGGLSFEGDPGTNYIEIDRLSSAVIDKQLQQPLRPGQIRSTLFLGENDSKNIKLDYLFGQDRYVITPGSYNTKATFFTLKALDESANTQITLNFREQ